MKDNHISEHFHIKELVHPEYINEYGEAKMAKYLNIYNPWMGIGLETLKEELGGKSIVINDYLWNEDRRFIDSGWRHAKYPLRNSSLLSGHYFALKTDCKIKGWAIKDLQEWILDNAHKHPNIVRMESHLDTPTWCDIQWGVREEGKSINVFRA